MQDETKKTEGEIIIDTAFEGVPDEVQNFMTSPLFDAIIAAIKEALALTEEQAGWVRQLSYQLLLRILTPEEGFAYITGKGITPETAVKILYAINTEIITRAQNITEFFTDDIPPDLTPDEDVVKPSNSLATLGDRLKQASIATPAKRDYSLTLPSSAKASAGEAEKVTRAIDPYHEAIDNE